MIDWLVVIIPAFVIVSVGIYSRRFIKDVAATL